MLLPHFASVQDLVFIVLRGLPMVHHFVFKGQTCCLLGVGFGSNSRRANIETERVNQRNQKKETERK